LEHYFSHVWEMMALERGTAHDLHGIQVGCGTLLTLRLYEKIRLLQPSQQKMDAFIAAFDKKQWEAQLRRIFGSAAEALIELEEHDQKNNPKNHAKRSDAIITNWHEILQIIEQELPAANDVLGLAQTLAMPITPDALGVPEEDVRNAFIGSREVRDKYVASSLLWDMGLLYEMDVLAE